MSDVFINPTSPLQQLEKAGKAAAKSEEASQPFSEVLQEAVEEVNHLAKASDQEVGKILSGDINDVHSAMVAMQKADLSFQMAMQVRNKLVEAYQEVMRMQV